MSADQKEEPLLPDWPELEEKADGRRAERDPASFDLGTAWGMRQYLGCLSKTARQSQAEGLMFRALDGWEEAEAKAERWRQKAAWWWVCALCLGLALLPTLKAVVNMAESLWMAARNG